MAFLDAKITFASPNATVYAHCLKERKKQNGQRSGGCIIRADGIRYPKEKTHLKLPYTESKQETKHAGYH
jgi:hypothetical protein